MTANEVNIHQGYNQLAPNATQVIQQIFLDDRYARKALEAKEHPLTLTVFGAGADAAIGLPTSSSLIPRIVEYLASEEGKSIDALLRKSIGGVRFHFDTFLGHAIDNLAKDLDRELLTICRGISGELRDNTSLTDAQRKLGDLIVRLFRKIIDIKSGAAIDRETELLIEEVLGTAVKDDSIIDFSRMNYTDTFKDIVVSILQKSIYEADHPILRHVYRNILDIEQLLSRYFYGFYTGQTGYVKNYMYIAWVLWAYLVHAEQQFALHRTANAVRDIYTQLKGTGSQLLTFNYTTLAAQASDTALYFHGSLLEYVDMENKNEFHLDHILDLDLVSFFRDRLSAEISFSPERKSIPVPSFLPPLKLQTVISRKYIAIWYHATQMVLRASRILVLGYSFSSPDHFFCECLRENREAQVFIFDRDMESVARHVCRILQLPPNAYSRQNIGGHEHRIYSNRIHIIQSDLTEVNLFDWLAPEC